MKIQVISDAQGRILSVHKPGDIGHSPSGIGNAGIVPAQGESIHVVNLPKALENTPLLDLHLQFLVVREGSSSRLIQSKEFKGPLRAQ